MFSKKMISVLGLTGLMVFGTSTVTQAMVVDSYLGWNYVSSNVFSNGSPITLPTLALNSITYLGAGGTVTQNMPDFTFVGSGMPDGVGLLNNPTYTTTVNGDGETTRTLGVSLPIDWIAAGVMTPWGSTYSFPTIGITGVVAFGVQGDLVSTSPYVVGLIPFGSDTELSSTLGGVQSDIYNASRAATFTAVNAPGITGTGNLIFAASAVPIPAAVWLFGSGLLGLIGVARRMRH
jgi:hypothetical protein